MDEGWISSLRSAAVQSPSTMPLLGLFVVALLGLVKGTRQRILSGLSSVYVFLFHRPLRNDPQAFLVSSHSHPLPATSSFLSAWRARSILSSEARSRGFDSFDHLRRRGIHHERDIDWTKPGSPRHGDLIESWDRIAEWDARCIHPSKLQTLRQVGDRLADTALEQASKSQKDPDDTDVLGQIYRLAHVGGDEGNNGNDKNPACSTFWKAARGRPPPGAGALGLEWYAERSRRKGVVGQAVDLHARWPQHPSSSDIEEPPPQPWQPESYSSSSEEAPSQSELDEELEAEAAVLRRGQDVFYKYAGPMLLSLLHFSLAGGFASPRITEVLRQTAYLVPGTRKRRQKEDEEQGLDDKDDGARKGEAGTDGLPKMDKARADRTWSRLLETTQFVLDVMEAQGSMRLPSNGPESGGEGWQSATRVRLLHTAVRQRVLRSASSPQRAHSAFGGYDVERNGVPINQEDLLATLCSFSVAPLASLQAMGIKPTLREREDFVALWRHVGFYMGLEPAVLRACFGNAQTADRTLWCAILHLFGEVEVSGSGSGDGARAHDDQAEASNGAGPPTTPPAPRIKGPTIPVLIACADRPPFHTPLAAHFAISRHLLGPSLSDSLGIPPTDALRTLITDVAFLGMRIPIWFGRFYRAEWERQRLVLARPLLRRLIVWSMGNKRSRFEMPPRGARPSSDQPQQDKPKEQQEQDSPPPNVATHGGGLQDVPEDSEDNLRLVRRWRWLMREMIAVCVLAGVVALGSVVLAVRRFW
ncbi:uncharacterized protein PFL1_06541 [Pseudozyma flocculosa PF-1]|uniref:ER-bound oxygenase mpaB/mpaB'/Rubber oxygenase catalytic domain-containing protein n=2 Tax=Pseudozyma flocculosa TaxID=84751 RepID=A0A5C3F856_9BASI|nr:uncharacterized protein PFL1_06541 [Pseudozyma flocculosa PF-1]EPQ25867.1 hypothetical protein PFL1_06541 [Pseudozyma flocculosa PF-1]SPO40633.1 uncharacterized protein PSFLO_06115 [Pseudozyma flocculosa]